VERFRPAEQVGASFVAVFADQRAGDVGGRVGVRDQYRELLGDTNRSHRHRFERGGNPAERLVELLPGHGLRVPIPGERRNDSRVSASASAIPASHCGSSSGRSILSRHAQSSAIR